MNRRIWTIAMISHLLYFNGLLFSNRFNFLTDEKWMEKIAIESKARYESLRGMHYLHQLLVKLIRAWINSDETTCGPDEKGQCVCIAVIYSLLNYRWAYYIIFLRPNEKLFGFSHQLRSSIGTEFQQNA